MATNAVASVPVWTERAQTQPDDLWQRLEAFRFDDQRAAFPFVARLARENGWTLGYAGRAIEEYRRFVFLAMAAGHAVTPSDQVDQVWHLHLLYTHSYWGSLCDEVLGRPLHHAPTRGGTSERERFADGYRMTLESYRRLFAEPPPVDIWPEPASRFGERIHQFRRVNTRDYWLLSRTAVRDGALVTAATLALALAFGVSGG